MSSQDLRPVTAAGGTYSPSANSLPPRKPDSKVFKAGQQSAAVGRRGPARFFGRLAIQFRRLMQRMLQSSRVKRHNLDLEVQRQAQGLMLPDQEGGRDQVFLELAAHKTDAGPGDPYSNCNGWGVGEPLSRPAPTHASHAQRVARTEPVPESTGDIYNTTSHLPLSHSSSTNFASRRTANLVHHNASHPLRPNVEFVSQATPVAHSTSDTFVDGNATWSYPGRRVQSATVSDHGSDSGSNNRDFATVEMSPQMLTTSAFISPDTAHRPAPSSSPSPFISSPDLPPVRSSASVYSSAPSLGPYVPPYPTPLPSIREPSASTGNVRGDLQNLHVPVPPASQPHYNHPPFADRSPGHITQPYPQFQITGGFTFINIHHVYRNADQER